MEKKEYKTKQRAYILNCIKEHEDEYVTIQQISDYLELHQLKVGLTTIYRTLDKLVEDGQIARVVIDGINASCYRFLPTNHEEIFFSMKCENCGRVMNIECIELSHLYHHLAEEHSVKINPGKTMFYGICENCAH